MSLLFFLRPIHHRSFGWFPNVLPRGKGDKKRKKKRVYKVLVEKEGVVAKEVDYTDFAVSLSEEIRVFRVKRNKKRSKEIIAMIQMMLEDE